MKPFLILHLLLSTFLTFAQNQQIDSLQQVLRNYHAKKQEQSKNLLPDASDTLKISILNELSIQFLTVADYDSAKIYADEALTIAQQIGFKKGISQSYNLIGNMYAKQGNYPEALKNFESALAIRKEAGDKSNIARSYNNIGNIYKALGNYPEALKNHLASLKIKEESGDKKGIATSYNNIGLIYQDQGNNPEALNNFAAALQISEEIGDKYLIGINYTNIGNIYYSQGNYPEALKNHLAGLKLQEEIGDIHSIALNYNNIGNTYYNQGNYPEALKNYFDALEIREEIGDKLGIAASHVNIGTTKIQMKMPGEGKGRLMKGLQLAKEIEATHLEIYAYKGLASADSALGNFKGAFENYKLFVLYRDSIINEKNTKKTVQMQMQYEFDKKETATKAEQEKKDAIAVKELQKQKLIRSGFTGGFAVVLLFAGVFFRQRNRITKGKKRSDELLLNILPSEVAEELKAKGSADAKQFDEVTVMFTDFKDFTQVSEKLSPAALVAEIHVCFKAFDDIISKHGIEKIKTIGDAYMCAGGLPVVNTTNATDVVQAALEIQQYMEQHLYRRKEEGKESFEIRIGINTGPVVAGIVGVKKFAYDIWGDTVNIAARMESSGEAGKVNISGTTFDLVKNKFNCNYRGKIQAKNKGEIDMYFVEGSFNEY